MRHVLAVPPVQGKAATAHILRLVESSFFPTELEQAKVQLRAGGLDRPKDSLVRAVADHLALGMLEGTPQLKARPQTAVALRAVYELYPGLAEPRVRRALNAVGRRASDQDLPLFFQILAQLPHAWDLLEQDNKARLTELVRLALPAVAINFLPASLGVPALTAIAEVRINGFDYQTLGQLLKRTSHPAAVARAVDIYCSSRSWDQANTYYNDVLAPVLGKLDQAQIRRILVAAQQEGADLNGAHSFGSFTRYIYDNQKLPQAEILATLRANGMDYLATWILTP